jgi:prepilin-type N-terminal cleavage/methylation domain-containing protein
MRDMTSQRGFTLVELLVAMMMSAVVIVGATTIMISTLNATQQVTQRTTALGEARTGVETLLAQLNSGCLINGRSPVLASTSSGISPVVSSDASHLVFVSGTGDSATATPTEHVVSVSGTGALIDSAYNYTGTAASVSTPSAWTFATSPSQALNLAEHVTTGSGSMFTYYAYSNYQTGTDSLLNAPPLATPLTTTTAPNVAEVGLDLRFAPAGSNYQPSATSELEDAAVFSLTAQSTGSQNAPCE